MLVWRWVHHYTNTTRRFSLVFFLLSFFFFFFNSIISAGNSHKQSLNRVFGDGPEGEESGRERGSSVKWAEPVWNNRAGLQDRVSCSVGPDMCRPVGASLHLKMCGLSTWRHRTQGLGGWGEGKGGRGGTLALHQLLLVQQIICFGGGGCRRERSEERRAGQEGRSRWSPYH